MEASVSQGGRFVAFSSDATDVVPDDTNGVTDVFVRDHVTNATERVSVATDGTQGDGPGRAPSISDDGRFVAFTTDATKLVGGDTDGHTSVVVRDRLAGTTTLVSTGTEPPASEPEATDAVWPAISGDGRTVAFSLAPQIPTGALQVVGPFVRNLATCTTTAMPDLVPGARQLTTVALSDDGRRIVYSQGAPVGQGNTSFRTSVVDTATQTVIRDVDSGELSGRSSEHVESGLSGDGRTVLYLRSGRLYRFSVDDGVLTQLPANPQFVAGGRQLALSDDGSVMALAIPNAGYALVGFDGQLTDASADPAGTPATSLIDGDLSGDGRFVAFTSADAGPS